MPIIGLTDQPARLPRVGQIRKGAPKAVRQPGADLNYFRFVPVAEEDVAPQRVTRDGRAQPNYVEVDKSDIRDEDGRTLSQIFTDAYGDKPTEIKLLLAYDTMDQCWQAWKEEWSGAALMHRCDGRDCERWWDPKLGQYSFEPKKCPNPDACLPRGYLRVILPCFQRLVEVSVLTGSKFDILTLSQNLKIVESLQRMQNGVLLPLRGIPCILHRGTRTITRQLTVEDRNNPHFGEKTGKRQRVTKSLLYLEVDREFITRRLAVDRLEALPKFDKLLLEAARPIAELEQSFVAEPSSQTGPVKLAASQFEDDEEDEVIEVVEEEDQTWEIREDDDAGQPPVTEPAAAKHEPAPAPEPKPAAKPAPDTGRPWSPSMLSAKLLAPDMVKNPIGDAKRRQVVFAQLKLLAEGNLADMGVFAKVVLHKDTYQELTVKQCEWLLEWMHMTQDKDGNWIASRLAREEYRLVLARGDKPATEAEADV
jgi:hypothetical protein